MFRCYRTWRRCSRSSAQGVMGRMAAQLSTERPIARTTRQQHNPLLMRRLRRWAGFVHTRPVCQGRSQFREGQSSSIPSCPWTIDTALLDHDTCSRGFLNNNAAAFRHSDMEDGVFETLQPAVVEHPNLRRRTWPDLRKWGCCILTGIGARCPSRR